MENIFNFKNNPQESPERAEMKKEILERLKLYHRTSLEKWRKVQECGCILSERELLGRGIIKKKDLWLGNDSTSTGELDRMMGRDDYIFASTSPMNYGNVTLEIDLSALQIPGAKVSTIGDFLMHAVDDEEYYKESEIPASEFISYLTDFLPTLPDKEWFWNPAGKDVEKFLGEALLDKSHRQDRTKYRTFYRLHPEIMFPRELPLKYVKNVIVKNKKGDRAGQ